jgi:hypothetical protein
MFYVKRFVTALCRLVWLHGGHSVLLSCSAVFRLYWPFRALVVVKNVGAELKMGRGCRCLDLEARAKTLTRD